MQLQLVLDFNGLCNTSRERTVRVAPLVPDLSGRHVDQILRIYFKIYIFTIVSE